MKQLLTFFSFIFATTNMQAQSIERSVIGGAGKTLSAGGYFVCYTVGESVILPSPSKTFSFPSNAMLTSIGFQQPHVAQTGAVLYSYNWVSAYPNPTTGWVRLSINGDNFQVNNVRLYNMLGQEVAIKPFQMVNGNIDLDLSNVSSGVYIVAVTDNSIGNTISTRIIKQNK